MSAQPLSTNTHYLHYIIQYIIYIMYVYIHVHVHVLLTRRSIINAIHIIINCVTPLLVVDKLVESMVRDRTVEFLESNRIIKDAQHGFSSKRSCLTNLLDFFHDLHNMCDNTRPVDIVYFHFQKPFDKSSS